MLHQQPFLVKTHSCTLAGHAWERHGERLFALLHSPEWERRWRSKWTHDMSESFQHRVQPWLQQCFGAEIAADPAERNRRFLEEALELVQANGCSASEAHQWVDYVFSRPAGALPQEVGGVMVTLASLCQAGGVDMHAEADTELARISQPEIMARIRAKHAGKPKYSR
jgi:hypothetical protein